MMYSAVALKLAHQDQEEHHQDEPPEERKPEAASQECRDDSMPVTAMNQ
jgi:hypothetical protein